MSAWTRAPPRVAPAPIQCARPESVIASQNANAAAFCSGSYPSPTTPSTVPPAYMEKAGYGSQGQSWIGTGQNEGISPDMLSQIFGQGQLQDIASQLGMSQDQAASSLAQALPQVVDRMTPSGAIPDDGDDLVARTLRELQMGRGR